MSGIEVAGLVLGAFPILVSALEHYRESAEVLSNWFAFRRKYQKVKHDIEWLRFSFTQNLKELLLPLICDEEEVEKLSADPGGELWLDPDLETKLKDRLAGAYVHYLRAIEDINEVMNRWMRELGLDKVDISKHKSTPHLLRIKFAFGQSTRDELFKEFKEYNSRLEEILQQGNRMQQISTANKTHQRTISRALKLIRKRATTVYHLLSKAWACKCRSLHHAHLGLEDKIFENPGTQFDVVFLYSRSSESKSRPWAVECTSIEFIEEETVSFGNELKAATAIRSTKRVTIAQNGASQSVYAKTVVQVQPQIKVMSAPVQSTAVPDIRDLCSTLARATPNTDCYGKLKADEECYQLRSGKLTTVGSSGELVSLQSLLQQRTELSLQRRQRHDVAYMIALANIQLYSTPWLSKQFGKASIMLSRSSKSNPIGPPLLVQGFSNPDEELEDTDKNENLTKLGILLLELCFGIPIESSSAMQSIRTKLGLVAGLSNPLVDRLAALEWSKQVLDETGTQYAAAVDWCLKVGQTSIDADGEWQIKAYENVVLPLQECCKLFR